MYIVMPGTNGGQIPWTWPIQTVMSNHVFAGIQPRSYVKAVSVFNHGTIPPAT